MKKILKKEVIIAFIIGIILASSIAVYAYSYAAKDVSYTKPGETQAISVETALNDLYSKSNKTAQQVTTLTTQGATYTMQNDGYIIGTANESSDTRCAQLYLNDKLSMLSNWNQDFDYNVSIYVKKNTVITTRSDGGTYNLTVYEWK